MSTYSSNLRIELISNGTQAGTWGDTTNNNLAYVLDSSIAGYQTISVTATSQALTYTSGPTATPSANQAIYAMLQFTTTTGAAFKVFAPPNSKSYLVWNNSLYAMTIYNSTVIGNTTAAGAGTSVISGTAYTVISLSGTTLGQWQALFSGISTLPSTGQTFVATATGTLAGGATVAATVLIASGDKVFVWSDGTTFYEIKTSSVTGIVPVVNGGTGQVTANAAFNALAPSQTSASGKYLKSDGTNTAWDAIDISTADITGTLAVANGGTNLGTYTVGDTLYASATTTLTKLAGNTTTTRKYLVSVGDGTNATAPAWDQIDISTSDITGTLPLANGGSGQITAQLAMNAFAGAVTSGSYLRGNGTNVVMNTIQVADVPTLNQNTTGTAANVTGIVAAANGGTGLATLTANNVLLGNGTGTLLAVAPGTSGNVLTSNGTTWASVAQPPADIQTITSTSTWTKPTGGQTMARIMVWGGGQGGGTSTGGTGGGYNEQTVPISYLAATVTATVGAGGTGGSSGTGGTSAFPLATAVNGVSTVSAGGGAAGATVQPFLYPGGDNSAGPANSAYGGGAGSPSYLGAGGTSVWGGAGGGGGVNSNNGVAPGGGGGTTGGLYSGTGAIGRIIVMCW
jgi:hypothetical protein